MLSPFYETRCPSPVTATDIFGKSWKSRLPIPGHEGLGGDASLFEDFRPAWFDRVLPGGVAGRSVLELGPFEAYQTYLLERLGAGPITSIEGNSFNFLKCVLLKNELGLAAKFLFGDFLKHLRASEGRYGACWASGVLYHQVRPLELLDAITEHTDALFLWTHYYDRSMILDAPPEQQRLFQPDRHETIGWGDYECPHFVRSYGIENYETSIPDYWEGGSAPFACWLKKDDIVGYLRTKGLRHVVWEDTPPLSGLPCASVAAWR